ncbi:uncharacterized protein [Hetaerina americana]|uniref:uncharacterized protein isoform X2 n=1 Tax=Hetaerina americana TaxID=62018 RepID=UPI003A7F627A
MEIEDERKEVTSDNELDYILSTSDDKIVKVSYFIDEDMIPNFFDIYHHEHSTIMVRALQSYFATLDESGAIAVFLVTAPSHDDILPAVYLVAEYQPSVPPILSLNIWGSKISGMTKEGTCLSADFLKREDTMKVECTPENGTVHVTLVENASSYVSKVNHIMEIEILQYYIWRSNIFMWITDDHKILISLNGNDYYEYNFENILNTYATAALLYGNLLIFGLESGSVVMYYFEAPEELLHLDLQCYHWLYPVANEPVITMDVCESSSGPLLAVLCHTNVHLIEWSCTMDDFINDDGKGAQTDQQLDYPLLTSDEEDEEGDEPYFVEEGMIPNIFDTYHHPHSNIMVRSPPNYFAPLGGREPFAMFDVLPAIMTNVFPPVHFFAGYHPYGPPVLPMNLWRNMVPSMPMPVPFCPPGFLRHHGMMKLPFPPERGIIHVTVVENSSPYEIKVYHYKGTEMLRYDHWSRNIFIWITHDHMLLVSPDGNEYYEYNVEKVLNTYPTTALLYGNLLILGLESGSVVMYCFETPEDLLFLDLQSYHWLQPVANEPVVKMDISQSSSGPLLVVFSQIDVYLVDWLCNTDDLNFDEVDV